MSSYHASAAVADKTVDEMEAPVIQECPTQDAQLNLDDLQSLDELSGPDLYARKVTLSLADFPSLDSRRIGWLLEVHGRFARAGGKLAVHSIRPHAMEALRFLRLDRVLHVAQDEAAARKLLEAGEPVGTD